MQGSRLELNGVSGTGVAIVSDEDWVRPTMRVVSVLLPGQVRGFRVADLETAKAWLSDVSE